MAACPLKLSLLNQELYLDATIALLEKLCLPPTLINGDFPNKGRAFRVWDIKKKNCINLLELP